MRTMFAFLAAPAFFPFAYLAWAISTGHNAEIPVMFTMGLPLIYAVTFGLGLPAHLVLRTMHEPSIAAYIVLGLALAVIAQVTYLDGLIANWRLWWGGVTGEIALGPVHSMGGQAQWWLDGAGSGGLFWLIARPDRTRPLYLQKSRLVMDGPHRSAP